ncbi:MAG TPA: transposase domain-containing protein [Caulobacteraceae bacterium]|nr:transposase domain-containing protein [Caulobacteraceae bacterium]
MGPGGGDKTWFTAAELAELALPGLPQTKRKINELASDNRWAFRTDAGGAPLARARAGRGGGFEYNIALLPPRAATELARRGLLTPDNEPDRGEPVTAGQLWSWYEQQTEKTKAEARRRQRAVDAVEALERQGQTRTAAISAAAAAQGVSNATLWNWIGLVAGVSVHDRLAHLAPRRQGGGAEAAIHPKAWDYFVADYLRPSKPTWAGSYARAQQAAKEQGWGELPHVKTFQRRLEREIDPRVVIMRRNGQEALRQVIPPQQRSVAALHALELVNIDGHRWDVFVKWPGPESRIARPMMVMIQDVYSRKILAWRIGESESAVLTRLAFGDLIRTHGIPKGCLMDNGRAFASKWITGGVSNRFRFKPLPEEPTGLLTQLGVKIHWATPYRGQSKPIERSFRDLEEAVGKHPACDGAYTGNKPDAKPENYGAKAVALADFKTVVALGIQAHNARLGRRTETANGRSFDQVYEESRRTAPIGMATEAQMRLALLAGELTSVDRRSGAVRLYGNTYFTPELHAIAGRRAIVRFDPDDLLLPVHVYSVDGEFIGTAPLLEQPAFLDAEAAKRRAKQESELRRSTRRAEEIARIMDADKLAAFLPSTIEDDQPEPPAVVRAVRGRGVVVQAAAAASPAPTRDPASVIDMFSAGIDRLRTRP